MWSTCTLCHIATNSRGTLTRRVWRKIQTLCFHPCIQGKVDNAGLDNCASPIDIDIEDVIHVRELDDDSSSIGNGSTREACTCPTRYQRDTMFSRPVHNADNIFHSARKHNSIR
jgi:hypothetical protein